MSEVTTQPAQDAVDATNTTTDTESTPAAEVDWKQKAREWERRAKDNKAAADKLAALEEAQKTAEQKAAERLADAERKAAAAELKALRAEVAQAKGVPAGLLNGSTLDELNDAADALLAFRGEAAKKPTLPPASGQGNVGTAIGGASQVTEAELASMSPMQINEARRAGRLDALLGKKTT